MTETGPEQPPRSEPTVAAFRDFQDQLVAAATREYPSSDLDDQASFSGPDRYRDMAQGRLAEINAEGRGVVINGLVNFLHFVDDVLRRGRSNR